MSEGEAIIILSNYYIYHTLFSPNTTVQQLVDFMSFTPDKIIKQFTLNKVMTSQETHAGKIDLIARYWTNFTDYYHGQCFMLNASNVPETRMMPIKTTANMFLPSSLLELRAKLVYSYLADRKWIGAPRIAFYLGQPKGSYENLITFYPGNRLI